MATRDVELAQFVREWAWLPIGDDARREVAAVLRERVQASDDLSPVDQELLTQLFARPGEAVAAPDDEKLATELAVLAVRVRTGADFGVIAVQFEELGGIGALDSPEAPVVQRLRYIVSQEIDAWNVGVLPATSDRVAGVPEGLYSADPQDRYEALQWIRSSWAFLAAEQNDDETWEQAYSILAEGYTRGIADTLSSPRAVSARCVALYDIEQYSDDAGVASAAAVRLDRELEGSLADYAFVTRALSFRQRIDNSQAPEKLVPLFERCALLEIEAEHHDEYEQQDWDDRLR